MKHIIALGSLLLLISSAWADAPLKTTLELDDEQARQVADIQSHYRKEFRRVRQEFNRESRKLRRARIDHDTTEVDLLEQKTHQLQIELADIRRQEDDAIRELLKPSQREKFERVIEQRDAAVGSSRDARLTHSKPGVD